MKRVEMSFYKEQKELDKLYAQLERAKKSYEKKLTVAVKYGVDTWDHKQHSDWLKTVETINGMYIAHKEDIKKNEAWWGLFSVTMDIEDIEDRIERAEKRVAKAQEKVQVYYDDIAKIEDIKEKEKLMQKTFEEEKKEWAKDRITLEDRYYGTTPKGNKFIIYGNNGITQRSFHCVTLRVNGETIFTSGEFWRAYAYIKNH